MKGRESVRETVLISTSFRNDTGLERNGLKQLSRGAVDVGGGLVVTMKCDCSNMCSVQSGTSIGRVHTRHYRKQLYDLVVNCIMTYSAFTFHDFLPWLEHQTWYINCTELELNLFCLPLLPKSVIWQEERLQCRILSSKQALCSST